MSSSCSTNVFISGEKGVEPVIADEPAAEQLLALFGEHANLRARVVRTVVHPPVDLPTNSWKSMSQIRGTKLSWVGSTRRRSSSSLD